MHVYTNPPNRLIPAIAATDSNPVIHTNYSGVYHQFSSGDNQQTLTNLAHAQAYFLTTPSNNEPQLETKQSDKNLAWNANHRDKYLDWYANERFASDKYLTWCASVHTPGLFQAFCDAVNAITSVPQIVEPAKESEPPIIDSQANVKKSELFMSASSDSADVTSLRGSDDNQNINADGNAFHHHSGLGAAFDIAFYKATNSAKTQVELKKAEVHQPVLGDITNVTNMAKPSSQIKESAHRVPDRQPTGKPTYSNNVLHSNPLFRTDDNQHSQKENGRKNKRHEPSDTTKTKLVNDSHSKKQWLPKSGALTTIFSFSANPINL